MKHIIQFCSILNFPNFFHGVSTRNYGNLKPQKNKNNSKIKFNKNQKNFFSFQNIPLERTVFMEQVHGTEIASCDSDCAGHWVPGVDGLVTKEKNLFLCVNTADCVPLFFLEPENKIIGIAHAGWKGTLHEIGKKVIEQIIKKHGGKIENILVGIGPAICGKCYMVSKERYEMFEKKNLVRHCERNDKIKQIGVKRSNLLKIRLLRRPVSLDTESPRNDSLDIFFLDLKAINVKILIEAGIKPENIEVSPYCTSCRNDLFFSYRKNKKKDYGEMVGVMGIKK